MPLKIVLGQEGGRYSRMMKFSKKKIRKSLHVMLFIYINRFEDIIFFIYKLERII